MHSVTIMKITPAIVAAGITVLFADKAGGCAVSGLLQVGNACMTAVGRSVRVKLLKIDRTVCWLQVQRKKNPPCWMNLNQIVVIADVAER